MESLGDFAELQPRRFRVDEYYRMAELGVIGEDERVELLEGVIVRRTPQNRPHARITSRLNGRLSEVLPRQEYSIRVQLPLSVSDDSEPEPDLAVVREEDERTSPREHPVSALLVIEIADSSLRKDRELKSRIYARAGVPEYVLVDVARKALEIRTQPDGAEARYAEVRLLQGEEVWTSSSLPAVRIPVSGFFE